MTMRRGADAIAKTAKATAEERDRRKEQTSAATATANARTVDNFVVDEDRDDGNDGVGGDGI